MSTKTLLWDKSFASDLSHLLRLGVQLLGLDPGVVHTVLLSAGDADLHLQPLLYLGHPEKQFVGEIEALRQFKIFFSPGEVLDAGVDVLAVLLLGEVEHVRGEKWLTVLGKVLLVGLQHAIEPGDEVETAVLLKK